MHQGRDGDVRAGQRSREAMDAGNADISLAPEGKIGLWQFKGKRRKSVRRRGELFG
jgi:hypothetical protein